MATKRKIRVCIPKGSLHEASMFILELAGYKWAEGKARTDRGFLIDRLSGDLLPTYCQPAQEIPLRVREGHADVAIGGQDWFRNWGIELPILASFPMGRQNYFKPVDIVLAIPKTARYRTLKQLPRKSTISTEYVELTQQLLRKAGRKDIKVEKSFGSTEQKTRFGRTAIVDVCETGNSLKANRLEKTETILESHLVVVANDISYRDKSKRKYIDDFVSRLSRVKCYQVTMRPNPKHYKYHKDFSMLLRLFQRITSDKMCLDQMVTVTPAHGSHGKPTFRIFIRFFPGYSPWKHSLRNFLRDMSELFLCETTVEECYTSIPIP